MTEHGKKGPGAKGGSRVRTVADEAPLMPTVEMPAVGAEPGVEVDLGADVDLVAGGEQGAEVEQAEDDLVLDALNPVEAPESPRNRTTVMSIPMRSPTGPEAQRARGVSMASTPLAPLEFEAFLDVEGGLPLSQLSKTVTVIGRVGGVADVMLPGEGVSRQHSALLYWEGDFYVEDLESINGTFVNDRRVKRVKLSPDDRIRIGSHTLTLRYR